MLSSVLYLCGCKSRTDTFVLPYCPAKAGDPIFSVFAYRFSSREPLNASRKHIVKVTYIISKSSLLAEAMKGTVPQERRQLLKQINARDQNAY